MSSFRLVLVLLLAAAPSAAQYQQTYVRDLNPGSYSNGCVVQLSAGEFTCAVSTSAGVGEPYVTVGNTGGLGAERAITPGTCMSGADGGPNGAYTLSVTCAPQLQADPAACPAGQYVSDVAADGTLTCGTPSGSGASASEPYLTVGNTPGLSAERAIAAGDGLNGTDGGPNGAYTLAVGAGTCLVSNADDMALASACGQAQIWTADHVFQAGVAWAPVAVKLTGTVSDWAAPDATNVVLDLGSSTVTLTGIATKWAGRILVLVNGNLTGTLVIMHESASSLASNRIILPGHSGVLAARDNELDVYPGETVVLKYETVNGGGLTDINSEVTSPEGRWHVLAQHDRTRGFYHVPATCGGTTAAQGIDPNGNAVGCFDPAASLPTVQEVEVDFGQPPSWGKTFTITDATVGAGSKVMVSQSGKAATGKSADENEMDPLFLEAVPAAGSFSLFAYGTQGPVYGKFKVLYLVGGPVGLGGAGTHNLLSTTHPDTTAASPAPGDLIAGVGSPGTTWSRAKNQQVVYYHAADVCRGVGASSIVAGSYSAGHVTLQWACPGSCTDNSVSCLLPVPFSWTDAPHAVSLREVVAYFSLSGAAQIKETTLYTTGTAGSFTDIDRHTSALSFPTASYSYSGLPVSLPPAGDFNTGRAVSVSFLIGQSAASTSTWTAWVIKARWDASP